MAVFERLGQAEGRGQSRVGALSEDGLVQSESSPATIVGE